MKKRIKASTLKTLTSKGQRPFDIVSTVINVLKRPNIIIQSYRK